MADSFAQAQQRILALNSDDLPFVYEPTPDGVVARWKYVDARWSNVLAAGTIDRDYELRVVLDPATSTWRFQERSTSTEATIGPGGLSFESTRFRGYRKTVSFSKNWAVDAEQTDRHGTTRGQSFGWSFTTDEVKRPVTDALAAAGWSRHKGFFARLFGG
ncbi:hypothetical protein [Microbacterium sp. 18062]|uniref:hypothetical protein n=1 Tax=Microbacterium sp. 18062 TaxID=2681410 RepID=UPI0013594CE5|nr:hypothetical protein [Microbacterium sp. 18062]